MYKGREDHRTAVTNDCKVRLVVPLKQDNQPELTKVNAMPEG